MLSIPEPCPEKWDLMQPRGEGRFCTSCSKVLVDFDSFTTEEVIDYIAARPAGSVCGRFRNDQLQQPGTTSSKRRSFRVFLAALWLAFGGFLFSSCRTTTTGRIQRSETPRDWGFQPDTVIPKKPPHRYEGHTMGVPPRPQRPTYYTVKKQDGTVIAVHTSYKQGVTEKTDTVDAVIQTKRIVVIGDDVTVYIHKVYTWGIFYFKDGVQISEAIFNEETSPEFVKKKAEAAGF